MGVIGTGSLAAFHINAYRNDPRTTITAICDANPERVRQKASELGIDEYYHDYRKMLLSDNIDAVSIITWNNTHAPIAIEALKRGKHVLCEKPPALNARQALEMKEAASTNRRLLMYGFIRRFTPAVYLLKEFINGGQLGEIYHIKTGILRRCGNPGGWFANRDISGGGPAIDLGVHIIDLAMYLMGNPKPLSLFGSTSKKVGPRFNIRGAGGYKSADYQSGIINTEDFANGLIRFENDATLYFETSWTMHIKEDKTYFNIAGSHGGASLEPELEIYSEKYNYLTDLKPVMETKSFDFQQAFNDEISHFADCILNGTQCIAPPEDGVTIMKILDALYESAETGQLIRL